MSWDREMQKALIADGEKLRQLTGEDRGPWDWPPLEAAQCPDCDEGIIVKADTSWNDPYGVIERICPTCKGLGWLPVEATGSPVSAP